MVLTMGSTLILVGAIVPVQHGISLVFVVFGVVAIAGGTICTLFAVETKGRVLEDLSPDVS